MDLVCADQNFFKNPQKLPLNKLYLQCENIKRTNKCESTVAEMLKNIEKPENYGNYYSVKTERKPAIDECWIHRNRRYVTFQPFYLQFDVKENSQFLDKNQAYLDCLQFFVTCSFQQFWCYVAFEPRFANLIVDFLENSLPPCAVKYLKSDFLSLHDEIYSCIYKIYQRLIRFSVSEIEFIEEEVAVKYLRKSNLISSGAVMNFCYLFLHSQKDFVKQLVDFCFSNKFKGTYLTELSTLLEDISNDLDYISMRSKLGAFNPMYIEETACYMSEVAESFLSFVTVCEPAFNLALELQFPHRLPHIYQKVYLDLYDMYDMKGDVGYDWSKLDQIINEWFALGRNFFINLFHTFIFYYLGEILKFKNQETEQEQYLEVYLALISTALDDDYFVRDYNQLHSVEEQFQLLIDNIPNFDKSQTEYLLQSLTAITAKTPKSKITEEPQIEKLSTPLQPFPQELYKSIYNTLSRAVPGPNQPESVLNALKSYEQLKKQWTLNPDCWIIEETPEVSSGDHFEEWHDFNKPSDSDILQKIAAVKEMLPDLSRDYILKQLECADYKPEVVITRILDEGSSASSGSVKMIAHIGKKPQYSDARDLLDDKTDEIKHLVLKASYNYEDDDDYDDRNEINNTFEPDKDDSKLYRHLKQNNLEYDVISDPSSSEDDEETVLENKLQNAFCEDPAVIRARREAQRGRVYKPSRDVVGRPKGQGQDNTVQNNRDKKNVHKSSRANHNRKGGAQWKRNRGMMPS